MNFRQVRKKIKTINNVKKITNAMEMVAAVKMKKAQQIALEGQPYRQILEEIIAQIATPSFVSFSSFFKIPKNEKELIIFISSNKGLCGAFNFNLFRFALKTLDFKKSDFIVLGKKGGIFLSKMGGKIIADFSEQLPFIDNVSPIFSLIKKSFLLENYGKVYLFYNRFYSTFSQKPTKEILLPLSRLTIEEKKEEKKVEFLIEPSPIKVLEALIEDYLKFKIRSAILESEAGEYSSRMMAMKNATENAEELIYNLTLLRNKLRQQSITYELLDMVTAREITS